MGSTGPMFEVFKFKTDNMPGVYSPCSKNVACSQTATTTTQETVRNIYNSNSSSLTMPTCKGSSSNAGHRVHFGTDAHDQTFGTKPVSDGDGTSPSTDDSSRLKLIQPPQESMDVFITRKKMFSSSSFYEEPEHIYPTVEEQVDLCRKIADSLSADTNKLSRGQSMYNKRKIRADKWVFEGPEPESETNSINDQNGKPNQNGVDHGDSTRGSRRLKLVLDPRQIQDAMKLRNSGLYNEHNVVSPEICFDLVKDLNSPTGKGAALFAKRKKKSEKWIVDENTVKQHEQLTETEIVRSDHDNSELNNQLQSHPRLKLIKSPWEAALESPIGCCDAAFQEVRSGFGAGGNNLAETVLKRADEYLLTNPGSMGDKSSSIWSSTLTESVTSHYPYARPNSNLELYKPRAPRGWSGGHMFERASSPSLGQEAPSPLPNPLDLDVSLGPSAWRPSSSSAASLNRKSWSLEQFTNFNSSPRLWTAAKETQTPTKFCPVRPPSFVLH